MGKRGWSCRGKWGEETRRGCMSDFLFVFSPDQWKGKMMQRKGEYLVSERERCHAQMVGLPQDVMDRSFAITGGKISGAHAMGGLWQFSSD